MTEPVLHFRDRKAKGALCGADTSADGHKLVRTWAEMKENGAYRKNACPECVKRRNAKATKPADSPAHKDQSADVVVDTDATKAEFTRAAVGLLQTKLYVNGRHPLPAEGHVQLERTVHSAVDVLDHYGLLAATTHPLVPLAINAFLLARMIKEIPEATSRQELNVAHGLPADFGTSTRAQAEPAPESPEEEEAA